MSTSRLYNLLVPDAPLHRRTDVDPPAPGLKGLKRAAFNLDAIKVAAEPGIAEPFLISSYAGRIDAVLLAFPSYGVAKASLSAAYRSVIEALRPGTKFVVVHHESDANVVATWFEHAGHVAANVSLVPLPDYVGFTDWAEDGYVAIRDLADSDSMTYLVEPWSFPRAGDALIADSVEGFASIGASQAPLVFQGGNCLIGDSSFWFLGKDYFADSVELVTDENGPITIPTGVSAETFVIDMFARFVDRKRTLLVVGTAKPIALREYYGVREQQKYLLDIPASGVGTFQPIFHIDMFVTLVGHGPDGRFQALVGDPRLADQALGVQSPYSLADVYDEIANQLTLLGFDVHRNPLVHQPTLGRDYTLKQLREFANASDGAPLLPAVKELTVAGATDATTVTVRTWHHITWNNCLVENDGAAGRHVYLPTFGHGSNANLSAIDNDMAARWQQLGFTVHALGDFSDFAMRQGVVHCLKKYLGRTVSDGSGVLFAAKAMAIEEALPAHLSREQVFAVCCQAIASVSNANPSKIREHHKLSTFVPLAAKANLVIAVRQRFSFVDTTALFNAFYYDVGKVGELVDFIFDSQPDGNLYV